MYSNRTIAGDGFQIHLQFSGDILRAQVEGLHDSFAISLAYWRVISEQRMACDARRVLVVENLAESGAREDVLPLFQELIQLGFDGCKIAFVDREDLHRSLQEHVAILAREHNILAAVFGQESVALNWLRHGEE